MRFKHLELKIFTTILIALVLIGQTTIARAQVTPAKAAELTLHKLERLIILKKVNGFFQTAFKQLDVSVLSVTTPSDPTAPIFALTVKPESGDLTLNLWSDADGRTLKFESTGTIPPNQPTVWPKKDPVAMAESSMHYLMDEGARNEDLVPFLNGLRLFVVAKSDAGANVIVGSALTAKVLTIHLDLEAVVTSYEIR